MSSSSMARQNFIEKLDTADTQATLGKPVDVVPDSAPTYVKPLKEETNTVISEVTRDFTPEEHKAFKADTDEWNEMQQRFASGTEEDAARVVAEAQENVPVREQVYAHKNEKMAEVHTQMDAPTYAAKIESELDSTLAPMAENLDYSIFKTNEEITKLSDRLSRDKSNLNNWDQIQDDDTIKPHLKSDTARQHVSQRVYDQEIQLKHRQEELTKLQKLKEEQTAAGTPPEQTSKTVLIEDVDGNVVAKSANELIEEVQTQRTLFQEFADCIKRKGV
jgi:hypothetical protein